MLQLLDSDMQVVVASNFIFLPLLLDPEIASEIKAIKSSPGQPGGRGSPDWDNLIAVDGRYFLKALSLSSLLQNFQYLHPHAYNQLKSDCLERYFPSAVSARNEVSLDDKLKTIIFQIMPHFVRKTERTGRIRSNNQGILEFIGEIIDIPQKYFDQASTQFHPELLGKRLHELENLEVTVAPLGEGVISTRDLRCWFHQAMAKSIIENEKDRLKQTIGQQEKPFMSGRQTAVLLYLSEKGSLEIDGFGFSRIGSTRDYVIYKHTGEYALKDYYGQIYLFPDCRVAVSTLARMRPVVMEKYKHPFLRRHSARQEICLTNFHSPLAFTASDAIAALEQGVNALYYGYNYRRRNGYHSLDKLPKEERLVDFEDLRIAPDHHKISSGRVEVKNAYR